MIGSSTRKQHALCMGRFALGSGNDGGRFGRACPQVRTHVKPAPAPASSGLARCAPAPSHAKPTPPPTPSSSRFARPPTPSSSRFAKPPTPSSSRCAKPPPPPPPHPTSRFSRRAQPAGASHGRVKAAAAKPARSVPSTKRKFVDESWGVETSAKSDKSAKAGKLSDGSKGRQKSAEELVSVVGSVEESDCAHRRRHPKAVKDCARCAYMAVGPQLRQLHGSYKHEVHGTRARTIWLAPRSLRLGGAWALGCTFCAFAAQRRADMLRRREEDDGTLGSTGLPWRKCRGCRGPLANTKWARFEIRALSQMAIRGVRQHGEALQHRRAARAYVMPDRAETVLSGQDSAADEDLFHR